MNPGLFNYRWDRDVSEVGGSGAYFETHYSDIRRSWRRSLLVGTVAHVTSMLLPAWGSLRLRACSNGSLRFNYVLHLKRWDVVQLRLVKPASRFPIPTSREASICDYVQRLYLALHSLGYRHARAVPERADFCIGPNCSTLH